MCLSGQWRNHSIPALTYGVICYDSLLYAQHHTIRELGIIRNSTPGCLYFPTRRGRSERHHFTDAHALNVISTCSVNFAVCLACRIQAVSALRTQIVTLYPVRAPTAGDGVGSEKDLPRYSLSIGAGPSDSCRGRLRITMESLTACRYGDTAHSLFPIRDVPSALEEVICRTSS
jgi:hypothetical protein